ncbi:MAG: hypothetical protein OXG35_15005 [Acidobacteria bacterium]|nr:hypothetical protein [Acidobacteriota bacterium]
MRFPDTRALAVPLLLLQACGGAEPAADPPAEEAAAPPPYRAFVTNETSGDLTVIAGGTHEVMATIPLGKRPRGIKVDPAGERLFVALSGSPPPPPGGGGAAPPPPPPRLTSEGRGPLWCGRFFRGGGPWA